MTVSKAKKPQPISKVIEPTPATFRRVLIDKESLFFPLLCGVAFTDKNGINRIIGVCNDCDGLDIVTSRLEQNFIEHDWSDSLSIAEFGSKRADLKVLADCLRDLADQIEEKISEKSA